MKRTIMTSLAGLAMVVGLLLASPGSAQAAYYHYYNAPYSAWVPGCYASIAIDTNYKGSGVRYARGFFSASSDSECSGALYRNGYPVSNTDFFKYGEQRSSGWHWDRDRNSSVCVENRRTWQFGCGSRI